MKIKQEKVARGGVIIKSRSENFKYWLLYVKYKNAIKWFTEVSR